MLSRFASSIFTVVLLMAVFTVCLGIGDKVNFGDSLVLFLKPFEVVAKLGKATLRLLGFDIIA